MLPQGFSGNPFPFASLISDQSSPPSVYLYLPSPPYPLFRVRGSPFPPHAAFGWGGSTAPAPIACTVSRSNPGLYVVPPFTDFQTPPLAAPTNTVMRPFSSTASSAAIRPLMGADPMLRAGRPDTVAASNL